MYFKAEINTLVFFLISLIFFHILRDFVTITPVILSYFYYDWRLCWECKAGVDKTADALEDMKTIAEIDEKIIPSRLLPAMHTRFRHKGNIYQNADVCVYHIYHTHISGFNTQNRVTSNGLDKA